MRQSTCSVPDCSDTSAGRSRRATADQRSVAPQTRMGLQQPIEAVTLQFDNFSLFMIAKNCPYSRESAGGCVRRLEKGRTMLSIRENLTRQYYCTHDLTFFSDPEFTYLVKQLRFLPRSANTFSNRVWAVTLRPSSWHRLARAARTALAGGDTESSRLAADQVRLT